MSKDVAAREGSTALGEVTIEAKDNHLAVFSGICLMIFYYRLVPERLRARQHALRPAGAAAALGICGSAPRSQPRVAHKQSEITSCFVVAV